MGRCQGGFCEMKIAELIESETGIRLEDVRYSKKDSCLFAGKAR